MRRRCVLHFGLLTPLFVAAPVHGQWYAEQQLGQPLFYRSCFESPAPCIARKTIKNGRPSLDVRQPEISGYTNQLRTSSLATDGNRVVEINYDANATTAGYRAIMAEIARHFGKPHFTRHQDNQDPSDYYDWDSGGASLHLLVQKGFNNSRNIDDYGINLTTRSAASNTSDAKVSADRKGSKATN